MLKRILFYGAIAGLIVGGGLFGVTVGRQGQPPSMALGYAIMLVAMSAIFVAIKQRRDVDLGGVIRFWPAFGMGIAISVIAGVFYVLAWEAALGYLDLDFAGEYMRMAIEEQRRQGASAEAIAKISQELEQFKVQYANPWFRLPITFTEVFPVGVLVSLVSAALLRRSGFMPARRS